MCEVTALPARPRGSKPTFRNGKQQKEKCLPHSCNPETETSLPAMNYLEPRTIYYKSYRAEKDHGFLRKIHQVFVL